MKVAYITPEFLTEDNFDGGLSNYLYKTSLHLKKFQIEPYIIVSSNKDEEILFEGIKVFKVKIKEIILFKILNKITRYKIYTSLSFVNTSLQLVKRVKNLNKIYNFDIIQHPSFLTSCIFKIKNKPNIVRISSYWKNYFKESGRKISIDDKILIFLEKLSIKKADYVFCPSLLFKKLINLDINKEIKIIETPINIIKPEMDPKIFEKKLIGKKYILFFGTLSYKKGLITVKEMLFDFLKKYSEYYFVFVGRDEGYLGKKIIDYLRESADIFQSRIIYLGKLKHEQLFPIINKADFIIIPSRIDNFPNTCLESMYLKKIDEIMNLDDVDKKKIQEAAYKKILDFRPEITIKKLINYYNSVLNDYKKNK